MRLIIVRHGETEENVRRIMQGQTNGTLTVKGRQQSAALARRLMKEKIDIIYSSDLGRTAHMAKDVAKLQRSRIYYVRSLRERHAGVFGGKPVERFIEDEARSGLSIVDYRPKGGESLRDLERRVKRFASGLYGKHLNKTVLLVTHGNVVKCLFSMFMGLPLDRAAWSKTKNAGVLIIEVRKGGSRKISSTMFRRRTAAKRA